MARITKAQKSEIRAKSEARYAAAREVVRAGKCPQCGAGLRRNLSITGWWQCEQYGASGFRKSSVLPPCSFQTFTE
jgi:hypothetical protein